VSVPQGIFIQLGAFSTTENADSFRVHVYRTLDWLNEQIHLVPGKNAAGANIVKLHLGPYANRTDAQVVADKIRDQLNLKALLVDNAK
jgi:rare lipoprotein A